MTKIPQISQGGSAVTVRLKQDVWGERWIAPSTINCCDLWKILTPDFLMTAQYAKKEAAIAQSHFAVTAVTKRGGCTILRKKRLQPNRSAPVVVWELRLSPSLFTCEGWHCLQASHYFTQCIPLVILSFLLFPQHSDILNSNHNAILSSPSATSPNTAHARLW